MLIKSFKANKSYIKKNIDILFAFELKIAKATPHLLQIKTREKFFTFLTGEHNSSTWLWNDQNDKLIGYLTIIDKPEKEDLEVLAIRVDPILHNSGYGREIMEFAEQMATKLGRKKISLYTNPKNLKAVGFYKRLGYRIVKEIDNYYGDGEPRYLCEKNLIIAHP